ncbi:MAG: pyridoxal-phosphate dependent enzyme [Haloarculaceae archaeon]
MPGERPTGLAAGAGGTPLVRAPRLDDDVGARVHVKYEGGNPTGTFKDRGSAVGVSAAAANGYDAVGTVSHGNMARSMAAHAASAGLDCLVLVPADIPPSRLGLIARHDPTILRVEGEYGRLYEASIRLGRERGIAFVNSDTPLRVAGQKTTGLEVAESFAPDAPDEVGMPVSSGVHASGVWKAFREFETAGLLDAVPRLHFVQAAACAPIAEAWVCGEETVTPVDAGETVAYSIANADPPSGNRVLAAARETGGGVLAVDDGAILDARRGPSRSPTSTPRCRTWSADRSGVHAGSGGSGGSRLSRGSTGERLTHLSAMSGTWGPHRPRGVGDDDGSSSRGTASTGVDRPPGTAATDAGRSSRSWRSPTRPSMGPVGV